MKATASKKPMTAQEVEDSDKEIEIKKMDLESGWLGRVFGSAKNASANIAGVVVLTLVLIAGALSFLLGEAAAEFWRIIVPIITMVLGYLFGKKS